MNGPHPHRPPHNDQVDARRHGRLPACAGRVRGGAACRGQGLRHRPRPAADLRAGRSLAAHLHGGDSAHCRRAVRRRSFPRTQIRRAPPRRRRRFHRRMDQRALSAAAAGSQVDPRRARVARREAARRFGAASRCSDGAAVGDLRRDLLCAEGRPACRGRTILRAFPRPDCRRVLHDARRHRGHRLRRQCALAQFDGPPPEVLGRVGSRGRRRDRPGRRLGIGFIGSGFNARFHMQAFRAVRDADVLGVWSPTARNAAAAAELARRLDVGDARPYPASPRWSPIPRSTRSGCAGPTTRASRTSRRSSTRSSAARGRSSGIACEKPLARNVAEAKRVLALVRARGTRRTAIWRTRSSRRRSKPATR